MNKRNEVKERLEEMKGIFHKKFHEASFEEERKFWNGLWAKTYDTLSMLEKEDEEDNLKFADLWIRYSQLGGVKTIPVSNGYIYADEYKGGRVNVYFFLEGIEIGGFEVDMLMEKAKERGLI